MTDVLRASEVFTRAGITTLDKITDRHFSASCPDCTNRQTLVQANFEEVNGKGVYSCRNCGSTLLFTRRPSGQKAEVHAAYRLNDYVLDLRTDVYVRVGENLTRLRDLIPGRKG